MAQTGYTPIQLYRSTTLAAAPVAGNLQPGELAININDADMALYAENASGVVKRVINNPAGLKYPTADGTAGQVVTTDGAGNLTMVTPTGEVTLNTAQTLTNKTISYASNTLTGVVGLTATQTLTNKRVTSRINSLTSTTSPWAWNSDSYDQQCLTALANGLVISADAGTPTDGQKTIFRIKDNGTSRAVMWTTGTSKSFRAVGVVLPTNTVPTKTVYVGCIYNANAVRWDAVAVSQEV
jgi:hypothetical protein